MANKKKNNKKSKKEGASPTKDVVEEPVEQNELIESEITENNKEVENKEAEAETQEDNESDDQATPLIYAKPNKNLKNLDKGHSQERKASGIYSQLSQEQISVLRDAFSLIDDDNDGIISNEDLKKAYKLINKEITDENAEKMFSEVQDPLAFGGFLSSLAGKLGDLSNKDELTAAFEVFSNTEQKTYQNNDKKDELKCNVSDLKESLLLAGMMEEAIDTALKSFIKTEMNGTDIFLAERFINTIRDD
ncbi:Mlc2 protein [Saccharomycopsis crataegensis]|uniref:Mlc2 protein n=1 Tax=Saccharomycopsis crataegensis TaxID=43959 RepID=A0AAV5QK72_9ASCO|nr:Mlc2 protein [Saccharomycopsis crataegensis]